MKTQLLNNITEKANLRHFFVAAFVFLMNISSYSQDFVNGSLDGPMGPAMTPTSWTLASGSVDVLNVPCPVAGWDFTVPATHSSDGGNFVQSYMNIGMGYVERFEQVVPGFTIGETYTITFEESNFGLCAGGFCPTIDSYWNVFVSGLPVMTSGNILTIDEGWVDGCVTFVATSTTHTIGFEVAHTGGAGINGGLANIDNLAIIEGVVDAGAITLEYDPAVMCGGTHFPDVGGAAPVGSFTFSPAIGLAIDPDTGVIDADLSLDGIYDVTYSVGCAGAETFTIEIVSEDAADFIYAMPIFCTGEGDPTPIYDTDGDGTTDGAAGEFTAVPAGLVINSSTGVIDFDASTPGTYVVTNTILDVGCGGDVATYEITLAEVVSADFIFDSPFYCVDAVSSLPNFDTDGDGIMDGTAGAFTATPVGLVIDAATGEINASSSVPGLYTVTNTMLSADCGDDIETFDVTIVDIFFADFMYSDAAYCPADADPAPLFDIDGDGVADGIAGVFTAPPSLVIDAATGVVDLDASTSGTYTVTNTVGSVECGDKIATWSITVNALPNVNPISDEAVCNTMDLTLPDFGSDGAVGTTFEWTNTTGIDVGFGLSGIGNIPTFTGTNIFFGPITVAVQVIATSPEGCAGPPTVFNVVVDPTPSVSFTKDAHDQCAPVSVKFNNTTTPAGGHGVWSYGDGESGLGAGSVTHTYLDGGLYDVTLTVTSDEGCTGTHTNNAFVDIYSVPDADFYVDKAFTEIDDREFEFTNTSTDAVFYEWNFDDFSPTSGETNPTHIYPEREGEYYVTLKAYGVDSVCSDTKFLKVKVTDFVLYFIPNTFTPDGDTYNEIFSPVFTSGVDPFDFHMTIFNKWGEIVFESYNKEIGWDGTYGNRGLVSSGTYIWQIEFKETSSDKTYLDIGHVMVMK